MAAAWPSVRVVSLDLRTMQTSASAPVRGARFSEVAALTRDFFAITDNNAGAGQLGVRIFRIRRGQKPQLSGGVISGDTPEGIVAAPSGHEFYVTSVNDDSLMRFSFDGRGGALLTGRTRTGNRPFGIALARSHRLLLVADNDTATINGPRSRPGIEAFALPSLRRRVVVPTGAAGGVALGVGGDEPEDSVVVTNEGDADVAAFSLPDLHLLKNAATPSTPWLPALDAARHLLYVPSAGADTISAYDARSLRRVWTASTCSYPTSVAVAEGAR